MSTESELIVDRGFWRTHSAAWRKSDLTQQAYCEQQGINFRSFVYHHNRLSSESKKFRPHFVEAKPESVSSNHQAMGLQLLLPNGVRIGISNDVNPQLLQTTLNIAKEI